MNVSLTSPSSHSSRNGYAEMTYKCEDIIGIIYRLLWMLDNYSAKQTHFKNSSTLCCAQRIVCVYRGVGVGTEIILVKKLVGSFFSESFKKKKFSQRLIVITP